MALSFSTFVFNPLLSRNAFGTATLMMTRSLITIGICRTALAGLAWSAVSVPAAAQEAGSFAGKSITMTAGFSVGGGVDLYGRMLGRHLVRQLPGHPGLIVLNRLRPGGVG